MDRKYSYFSKESSFVQKHPILFKLHWHHQKVSKTLISQIKEVIEVFVCLLSTSSQPVVMQTDILSVQPLFWGRCLWDCVCCQMLYCNWKETVWTLLPPPAAAAGTSGALALSGTLLAHLFIQSFVSSLCFSTYSLFMTLYSTQLNPHVECAICEISKLFGKTTGFSV